MGFERVERGPAAPVARGWLTVAEEADALGRTHCTQAADAADGELFARWQAGDQQAFEQLISRHEQRVFRLLLRMLGNREEAEALALETFLSLHRNGHRYRGEAPFASFVYRIAANAAVNRRRARGRTRQQSAGRTTGDAGPSDSPFEVLDRHDREAGEQNAWVQQALDRLSPSLRFPVVLHDIEDRPYEEIARILGVARRTVRSRIQRARRELRRELGAVVGPSHPGTPL